MRVLGAPGHLVERRAQQGFVEDGHLAWSQKDHFVRVSRFVACCPQQRAKVAARFLHLVCEANGFVEAEVRARRASQHQIRGAQVEHALQESCVLETSPAQLGFAVIAGVVGVRLGLVQRHGLQELRWRAAALEWRLVRALVAIVNLASHQKAARHKFEAPVLALAQEWVEQPHQCLHYLFAQQTGFPAVEETRETKLAFAVPRQLVHSVRFSRV